MTLENFNNALQWLVNELENLGKNNHCFCLCKDDLDDKYAIRHLVRNLHEVIHEHKSKEATHPNHHKDATAKAKCEVKCHREL